ADGFGIPDGAEHKCDRGVFAAAEWQRVHRVRLLPDGSVGNGGSSSAGWILDRRTESVESTGTVRDQHFEVGGGGGSESVCCVAGLEQRDGEHLCELLHRRRHGADAV